jgi:hypothetical protein
MAEWLAGGDSFPRWRVHALLRRIHLLEEHALTLKATVRTVSTNMDVRSVLSTLHRAEAQLNDLRDPEVVVQVEEELASVIERISGLHRAP